MIDLHAHILPGLDDGPSTWEDALEMAAVAAADGIRVMAATPHLFNLQSDHSEVNDRDAILRHVAQFNDLLRTREIPLKIVPGCDTPLSLELFELLEANRLMTLNDGGRYLLLELPYTAFPPGLEEACFRLKSRGLTPIITHPERHFIIQEMPEKLVRLLTLGCLAQLTASSLLGGFGRQIAKFSRQLVKRGYIHILATDAHDLRGRPPRLKAAVAEAARLVGEDRARAMVTALPERIIQGLPCT